jgi:hypothetical protein
VNFLSRFLKILIVALLFSALGALAFYLVVIQGSKLREDVSNAEYVSTIYRAVGGWLGFITFLSLLLAFTGMKRSITFRVDDREAFLGRVTQVISDLRYRPSLRDGNQLTFKPPALGGLMAEKISVHLEEGAATITGPRALLTKIQRKL